VSTVARTRRSSPTWPRGRRRGRAGFLLCKGLISTPGSERESLIAARLGGHISSTGQNSRHPPKVHAACMSPPDSCFYILRFVHMRLCCRNPRLQEDPCCARGGLTSRFLRGFKPSRAATNVMDKRKGAGISTRLLLLLLLLLLPELCRIPQYGWVTSILELSRGWS
jgi:hypothetical protein